MFSSIFEFSQVLKTLKPLKSQKSYRILGHEEALCSVIGSDSEDVLLLRVVTCNRTLGRGQLNRYVSRERCPVLLNNT